MPSKNIILNRTLEQYNKKYRHRRHRLKKYTKQEVDEYDKKNHTAKKEQLLKGRKWWLIKDTYYEIPKPIRLTWFRNLNAGVQIGVCLLCVGVLATAVAVPLVLMNQNKVSEPEVKIEGEAEFNKSTSHIELNKDSTIALNKKDKEITGVEYVKVGDKTLTESQYSFDKTSCVVTIKAEAMISTKIVIKVIIEESVININVVDMDGKSFANNVIPVKTDTSIKIRLIRNDSSSTDITDLCEVNGIYPDFKIIKESGYFEVKADPILHNTGESEITFTYNKTIKTSVAKVKVYKFTKEEFGSRITEWTNKFCKNDKIYQQNQIKVKVNDIDTTIKSSVCSAKGDMRSYELTLNDDNYVPLASFAYATLDNYSQETIEGVFYTIEDSKITYEDTTNKNLLEKLVMNVQGYATTYKIVGGDEIEITYTGEPQ